MSISTISQIILLFGLVAVFGVFRAKPKKGTIDNAALIALLRKKQK